MSESAEVSEGDAPPNLPLVIRCRENGPYVIQGPVRIVDHLGQEITPPSDKPFIALCRCGSSRNKPFCDGAHKEIHFNASGQGPS